MYSKCFMVTSDPGSFSYVLKSIFYSRNRVYSRASKMYRQISSVLSVYWKANIDNHPSTEFQISVNRYVTIIKFYLVTLCTYWYFSRYLNTSYIFFFRVQNNNSCIQKNFSQNKSFCFYKFGVRGKQLPFTYELGLD